ncbi:hypothetical protein C8R45DRAFT_1216698 [Mycena sanguinolenta]|nr:hypothetical protein C8R45DRAFT_1216698 [Mycena sanguinolenta]
MSRRIPLNSMAAALLLSDLAADVIFSILAFCDIASVVSVGQTCRSLHALAFEKSVWLVLLDNLRRRCILDHNCTPNLETLSTAEMIEIVKRLLIGPQTWSPENPNAVAEISRKITLHPDITMNSTADVVKLLQSGRYVLFTNSFELKCWSVADDSLVWRYTSIIDIDPEDIEVQEFAAEETEADVTIMVCIRTYPDNGDPRQNYVEIVNLNLRTGTHASLLLARAHDSEIDNIFSDPVICGALGVVKLNLDGAKDLHMVLNLKMNSCLIVQSNDPKRRLHFALVPGHILLSEENQLHLISSDTLSTLWAPTIATNGTAGFLPVFVRHIPKLKTMEASHAQQSFDVVHAHESPVRDGHYSFSIYGAHRMLPRAASLSYRLFIPTNGEPRWCQRTQSVVYPNIDLARITDAVPYSGHRLHRGTDIAPIHTILSTPLASTSPRIVQAGLPPIAGRQEVDIAPYSGALTYSNSSSVVVQYYR